MKVELGNIKGPKGAQGDKGEQGIRGETGAAGKRGSRWSKGTAITGTSTTAAVFSSSGITDALVGDMYINTSTQNVYQCTVAGAANVAKWVYCCNLKGAAGVKGEKGDTGNRGEKGDSGPRGLTGDAAGFGTPEAVIDAGTGTPSVTVTASGPPTAKIFKFVFKNLVGKQGPAGDVKTSVLMTETDYTTMWNTIKS